MSKSDRAKGEALVEKLFDGYPAYQRRRLMGSHCLQSPDEKNARIRLVQELSLELAEVKKSQRFILFGETAIESVIEGDWKRVADVMGWLTFKDESLESMQAQAPSWERFRELLRIACVEARHRQELLEKHVFGQKENN